MRLLIVSNRLEVTVTEEHGRLVIKPSSGGLVTGMKGYLDTLEDTPYLWIGWPGDFNFSDPDLLKKELFENFNSWPVLHDAHSMDLFYNGFSNMTLWPLFHYFPSLTVYDEKMWENYKEVNERFAEEIALIVKPGDIVWIHDYHFLLLPGLLREKKKDLSIGFFLHIPFPTYEVFRLLPRKWGKELLRGMVGADLIGFHTYDYAQYFLRGVLRVLGYLHDMGTIDVDNRLVKTATYPMGIDFEKFNTAVSEKPVYREKRRLRRELRNLKVIFSVDRQDYTKGILKRLEGYELFLRNNPLWLKKVVLVMVVVPSRSTLEQYQIEQDEINKIVGKINGEYGDVHWTPVIFQYRAIEFEQLAALYNISDVGLVTPLRDGMNLVAKEFIAAQTEKKGVLILSEMAGASMELGEALIINPNHREEIAEAIKAALEMPGEEQALRVESMQLRLQKYNAKRWAEDFLVDLETMRTIISKYPAVLLHGKELDQLLVQFSRAQRRIMFLDYDGTLVPFASTPREAVPGPRLNRILRVVSEMPSVKVVLISGRERKDLQRWYERFNLTLVAEHGVWIREPGETWRLMRPLKNDWKPAIRQIVEHYKDRLLDSFIEEKEYGIVWHFRNSDPAMSELRVKEFVDDMIHFTARNELDVLLGNNVVEIKCSGINKGKTAQQILAGHTYDFIMAAGDDFTDETLFKALPKGSYTIKIGRQKSFAHYRLDASSDLLNVLERMMHIRKGLFQNIKKIFRKK